MRKRIMAGLAALVLALTISLSNAQAAFATTYHSCIGASVCLYQWTNFTGPNGPSGRYQVALTNIWHASTGCWNILAWWPNSTPVRGNSWSFVSNPEGTYSGPDWKLYFYTGANCTGTSAAVSLAYETENDHLGAPFVAGTPGIYSMSMTFSV